MRSFVTRTSFIHHDNNKFKFTVGLHMGSGFITADHTEYLLGQAGVGASYLIARNLEFVSEVTGALRFRKEAMPGAMATAGIRALFD